MAFKGQIPDDVPCDFYDQMAMCGSRDPGARNVIMRDLGDTPRLEANYGAGEWVKMQFTLDDGSGRAVRAVHWFRNTGSRMHVE